MVASTRPCLSSVIACAHPSTASTFAPLCCASLYQLLVRDCAVVLPFRSSKEWMLSLSDLVTITPVLTVYGVEKSYFALRSSVMETWLATTSNRLASRPAKMASNCVSWKAGLTPSFAATAFMISTS